jgi:hypothetical protein
MCVVFFPPSLLFIRARQHFLPQSGAAHMSRAPMVAEKCERTPCVGYGAQMWRVIYT